ncbi:hypothetical protein YC2023_060663 [Brassica napus]
MDFRPGTRRLDGLSSRNSEAGWTIVLEPGGWMDYRPGARRLVELLSRNPMVGFLEKCLPLSKPGSVFQCVVQLQLGRLKDGTICVRFVNLEYRDATHSTFRRQDTRNFFPRDSRSLLWTRRFNSWIPGIEQNRGIASGPGDVVGTQRCRGDPKVVSRARRLP